MLIETGILVMVVIPWHVFGLLDLRVAGPIWLVRGVVAVVVALRMLAPLRAVEGKLDQATTAQLHAADRCAQELARGYARIHTRLIVAALLIVALLAWAGIPAELMFGKVELVVMLFMVPAVAVMPAILGALQEATLGDTQALLWSALEQRGETPERPETSSLGIMSQLSTVVAAGSLIGTCAIAYHLHATGLRDADLQARLRVAERASFELELGRAWSEEVEAQVQIVEEEALEPWLRAEVEQLEPGQSFTRHDARSGRSYVLVPTGDGRWALAQGEAEVHLFAFSSLLLLTLLGMTPLFWLGFSLGTKRLSGPLERYSELARRFALDGELSSLERMAPTRNDELGRLALNFNAMLERLEQLERAASSVARGDLTMELEHPGELHDAFRSLLARLRETVGQLREGSVELSRAAARVDELTREQDLRVRAQSEHVERLRGALVSLAGSAASIADESQGVLHNAELTVATNEGVREEIAQLREATHSLEELLGQVGEIADRSDLLALNGALEATRAGEAGRGFMLVAAEMRRLAERVTAIVADGRVYIERVEVAGVRSVETTDDSGKLAEQTATAARAISSETTRQSAQSARVSSSVEELGKAVAQTNEAIARSREAAEGMRTYAARLTELTVSFTLADGRGDSRRAGVDE